MEGRPTASIGRYLPHHKLHTHARSQRAEYARECNPRLGHHARLCGRKGGGTGCLAAVLSLLPNLVELCAVHAQTFERISRFHILINYELSDNDDYIIKRNDHEV